MEGNYKQILWRLRGQREASEWEEEVKKDELIYSSMVFPRKAEEAQDGWEVNIRPVRAALMDRTLFSPLVLMLVRER
jgi:hypothetical protein